MDKKLFKKMLKEFFWILVGVGVLLLAHGILGFFISLGIVLIGGVEIAVACTLGHQISWWIVIISWLGLVVYHGAKQEVEEENKDGV